jgi:hypothetical protein
MALNGDRRAARNIATSLDYPRTDDRFVNAFGGAVNQFRFNDPATWAADFDDRFAFTTHGSQFQQERVTDLAAAAMRCRVALERQVPCDKRYRGADPRKMAKAQAVGGDSRSVLARMKALGESEEVETLLGLAEGFAEFRDENDHVKRAPAAPSTAVQMELWTDLGADPPRAWPAAVRLQTDREATLLFFRQRIRPATPVAAGELTHLLTDLDAPAFATRESAQRRLTAIADRADAELRAAPRRQMSSEGQKRLDCILNSLGSRFVPSGDAQRLERAVSIVERFGTLEARRLLEEWATGVATARLTCDAKAALDRLDRLCRREALAPE